MTISNTLAKAGPFAGNGVTTVFPFTFKVFQRSDVKVVKTSVAGVETVQVLDLDYSIALNVDQNAAPGGSATTLSALLAVGEKLTLVSNVPDLQQALITNGGGFFPAVINDMVDTRTILSHQNKEKLDRSLSVPVSDAAAPSLELPPVATRAGKFATYDVNGSPSVATGAASSPVSAAMAPVVAAATVALAQEALSRFYPVTNPSSGNIQGSGFAVAHQLVYSDANTNFRADAINLVSTDPSVLLSIPLTGSVTVGDTITLRFLFNALNIPVSYTAVGGDTLSTMAAALVNAIKANASLFQPVSVNNTLGGGLPGQILYVIASGATIHLDWNVNVTMTMTQSVSGAATEIVTLPGGGSPLPTQLDANPVFALCRNTGVAPAAGSNIGQYGFFGTQSSAPGSINVQYGSITCDVLGSTSGALNARVGILTCNPVTGGLDRGIFVSNGLYSTSAVQGDKGIDTANFKAYYIDGVNIKGNLPATNIADNAAAGTVGEYVESNVVTPGAGMTTGVTLNATSMSLTPGDWDVWFEAAFTPAATTTVTFIAASISVVSTTLNNVNGSIKFEPFYNNTPGNFTGTVSITCGPARLSLASTTTVYGVAQSTFGVSTLNAAGRLRARRVR